MPSGCQHTQSARQLTENRALNPRAPNPIGRVKGPVRIRSASPKRTRPWLAGCGDRWRPGWQPSWYNGPPPTPPPPSLVRGQNNPMWSRDDATGCFHMNHSSRSILPVVSAASGENVLIKFTEPNQTHWLPSITWTPVLLAVHFTHTVNEVERALQKQLNFSPPHTRIVLVSPSCSDGSDHVLTLCRAQSTFKLGIIITEPLDEEYLTQQYFPSAVPIGDYHMVGGRVYQAPGRDARFHTTPCRGHTHADVDQHFALMQTMQSMQGPALMPWQDDILPSRDPWPMARTGHTHYHADQRFAAAAAAMLPDAPALTRPAAAAWSSLPAWHGPACTTWSSLPAAAAACSSHTMQHATDDESSSDNGMPPPTNSSHSDDDMPHIFDEVGHEDEDEDAD